MFLMDMLSIIVLQDEPKPEADNAWRWADKLFDSLSSPELDNLKLARTVGYLDRSAFVAMLNARRPEWLPPGKIVRRGLHLRKTLRSPDIVPSAQLRLYIDEWLDTGMTAQGAETSSARDLTKAPGAHAAISRFAGTLRVQLEVRRDGLGLRLPNWSGKKPLERETPLEMADKLCALFFLCDWRLRLAKCRRAACGRYFELMHWKRVYKRGIACPDCARVRSAVLSTSKARKKAETELYRLVARRFGKRIAKTPDWYRDPKLRAEITQFMKARIEDRDSLRSVYRASLTGKWLSWSKNRYGIEEIVKGRIHAGS
jgi:hypothetical protein